MDQAWKLLQEKVGEETLNSDPLIRMLAKEVAAECGGLPLALITIGRAMAYKKSPHEWRYGLEVLRRSPHKFARLGEGPFPLLKFSYDSLPSNSVRSCLLYCSLYPQDYSISKATLIDYWYCEGLLDEFDSISSARMQGYNIIGVLVDACLLNEDGKKFVKMHDVIRDMTLRIVHQYEASENRFFVRAGVGLEAVPEVETWQGVRRISLMQNGIKELSSTPTCPTLQTLFLNKNDLQVIGGDFLQFMSTLRVLNLSDNRGLRKLPKGISKLVSLELLDLSRTGITELPIELKSSKNLKHLNLSSRPPIFGFSAW
ncbi:Leucine-rich repeat - like 10 [Theobroma cacao]|nr:Leucine-rich repeat - like 10 [Theobroma cacao]